MSLKKQIFHVLNILLDNLKESQPQLVPSINIAGQMDMSMPQLRPVLKAMKGMGVIESDPDLQYTLITLKGLSYLGEPNPMD
ncbi:MAG: hypothetical protein GY705_30910 [Bacteroidetes bacterium]|nr:hypothetical protein [Bacteroidota bacterium]